MANVDNITQAVRVSMELFRDEMIKQLAEQNINASGKLSASTEDVIVDSEGFVSGTVRANQYWFYRNFGRGATVNGGTGKLRPKIEQWIKDKGIVAKERNGKTPTDSELAFLITRKIHRDGYEGKAFVSDTTDVVQPEIDKLIADAAFKDLNSLLT
jgi:hypothetical protein